MPADIYYSMLFTEQGMGNLVSITDAGSTAVKFSALIDFGSIIGEPSLKETVVFLVKYILANRTAKKPGPDLDLVVVSHQDKDHWNLIPYLIKAFPAAAPLTVGTFAFGGLKGSYSKEGAAVLDSLAAIATTSKKIPAKQCSAYAPRKALGDLASYSDADTEISFRPVICNVASPCTDESMVANTPSLVVAVVRRMGFERECEIFLPGDMTSHTIAAMYDYEDRMKELCGVTSLSIPHHGAHRTLADNYSQPRDKRKFLWANWFAVYLEPKSLGASAGKSSTFNHPYEHVINIFEEGGGILVLDESHSYVSYDIKANDYSPWTTDGAVFTNFSAVPKGKSAAEFQKIAHRIVYKITKDELECSQLDIGAPAMPGSSE